MFHAGFCAGNPDNGLRRWQLHARAAPDCQWELPTARKIHNGAVAPGSTSSSIWPRDWDPLSSQYFRTCRTVALKGGDFLQGFDGM